MQELDMTGPFRDRDLYLVEVELGSAKVMSRENDFIFSGNDFIFIFIMALRKIFGLPVCPRQTEVEEIRKTGGGPRAVSMVCAPIDFENDEGE